MSGNHRLDDCKGERERVAAAGSEVSQSLLDGKPVGPMRVWPGGLAMSRSIGDHEVRPCLLLNSGWLHSCTIPAFVLLTSKECHVPPVGPAVPNLSDDWHGAEKRAAVLTAWLARGGRVGV